MVAATSASGENPGLTPADKLSAESFLATAYKLDDHVWAQLRKSMVEEVALRRSRADLARTLDILARHVLASAADPVPSIKLANSELGRAAAFLGSDQLTEAHSWLGRALAQEAKARIALVKVPTASPTPIGPPFSGSVFAGTLPNTADYAITPTVEIDAYKLTAPSGVQISSHFTAQGWSCSNLAANIVECMDPTLTTGGFTGILNYVGPTPPTLSGQASNDGGNTFGPSTPLK
jgi:hypothetical protein